MNKQITVTASILGMLAVVAGAFGAHALKKVLSPEHLETWRTAVQYHFYHVFAILFLAIYARDGKEVTWPFIFFLLGIICFSGSLYLLSCRDVLKAPGLVKLGPITPLGGLFFIIGWAWLAVTVLKAK